MANLTAIHNITHTLIGNGAYHVMDNIFRIDNPDNTFNMFYGTMLNNTTVLWNGWC